MTGLLLLLHIRSRIRILLALVQVISISITALEALVVEESSALVAEASLQLGLPPLLHTRSHTHILPPKLSALAVVPP